jgi:hypothetical protein
MLKSIAWSCLRSPSTWGEEKTRGRIASPACSCNRQTRRYRMTACVEIWYRIQCNDIQTLCSIHRQGRWLVADSNPLFKLRLASLPFPAHPCNIQASQEALSQFRPSTASSPSQYGCYEPITSRISNRLPPTSSTTFNDK